MKSITVYCGANHGNNPNYTKSAQQLGKLLATNNIRLVYGGGHVGLMGVIADAVLENGGEVIGVIPQFLVDKELAHPKATEMIVTQNMHERKAKMLELADGFIAMPGGFGTMEEYFEALCWGQLDLHKHPIGLLNVDGFYDHLLQFFEHMSEKGLLRKANKAMVLSDQDPTKLLEKMNQYTPVKEGKWM